MVKSTAVEKRFFPWTHDRFVDTLVDTAERLHWSDCQVTGSCATARSINQIKLGDSSCPLELTMNASWHQIGDDGIELVLSVTEENNSWSVIECKKQCRALADFLCSHLFSTSPKPDVTVH